ncbi:MAG: hypothetical protein CL840_00485 [Crocinitomicaceae bacterium]|nr:hypothetical protein [Crocinitomicaceae bacterium]|tara:strand:- start:3394 stop:3828 length:435 start_codon:yes stop_codon:yes gene_type:complete
MRKFSLRDIMGYLTMWFYLACNVLMESYSILSMRDLKSVPDQLDRCNDVAGLHLLKGEIRSCNGAAMMGAAMSLVFGIVMAAYTLIFTGLTGASGLLVLIWALPIVLFTYFIEKWRATNGMFDSIMSKISQLEYDIQHSNKTEK